MNEIVDALKQILQILRQHSILLKNLDERLKKRGI